MIQQNAAEAAIRDERKGVCLAAIELLKEFVIQEHTSNYKEIVDLALEATKHRDPSVRKSALELHKRLLFELIEY